MPVVPLRVLLDTNIYGFFFEGDDPQFLPVALKTGKVVFYGFEVVRKELRATPKKFKHGNRSYRSLLLSVYDELVKGHSYRLSPVVEALAQEYSKEYAGGISKKELWKDFLIVACASIHGLDLIVSEDNHSMVSAPAISAYKKVNARNDLREPVFYSMEKFKKLL